MLQQPSRDEWRWGSAVRGGRRSAARGTASVEYAASRTRACEQPFQPMERRMPGRRRR